MPAPQASHIKYPTCGTCWRVTIKAWLPRGGVTLVWIVRTYETLEWVRPYMDMILRIPNRKDILRIQVFFTRPQNPRDIVSTSSTVKMFPGRPNIYLLLRKEVQDQIGAMSVSVCGPGGLADVRGAVRAAQGDSVVDFIENFTW